MRREVFEQWCWQLGLSDQAKAVITQIRTSPPARHVQSGASNVSGTYPSIKMGCAIQFESHRDELPFAYLMDHDPQVLEFYDQPAGEIKLKHRNWDDTRNVTTRHTPDFFVLREDGAGWVECKMEDDLVRLAEQKPFRYQKRSDGSWFCPPGEAYAAQFGLTYQLFSSQEIDWTYIQNLRFLGDYLRGSPPPVSPDVALARRTTVMSQPEIRLLNLIATLQCGKADAIYQLILTDQLYVNLRAVRLTDYEHVQVFLDHDQAESYATLQPTATSLPRPSTLPLTVGASIVLDGKAWTIFNPGATCCLKCGKPLKGDATSTPQLEAQWEYCEIDWHHLGYADFWNTVSKGSYFAISMHPTKGRYLVAESGTFDMEGLKFPHADVVLNELVKKLTEDGWELLPTRGEFCVVTSLGGKSRLRVTLLALERKNTWKPKKRRKSLVSQKLRTNR